MEAKRRKGRTGSKECLMGAGFEGFNGAKRIMEG
jgi:hypothetical protein